MISRLRPKILASPSLKTQKQVRVKKMYLTVIVVNGEIPSRLPGVAVAGDGHPVEDGVAGVQLLDLMRRKCFAALPALDLDGGFRTRLRLRWFDDRVSGLNRTLDGPELP